VPDRGLVAVSPAAVATVSAATAAAEATAAATAAESASAAAATAATESATTAAAATTAATAFFTRPGFVDGQGASAVLLAVEGCNGSLRFLVVGHFDESETFAPAGVPIVDDLGGNHLPVSAE
jgi:hypothetical protein